MNLVSRLATFASSLIPTPDGTYTIQDHNKYVHSSRSPLKEAQKIIDTLPDLDQDKKNKTLIIAWGTGLGYHIEMLIDQGYHVLAIELRPTIAQIFQEVFPIKKLVAFITDQNSKELFDRLASLDSNQYQHFIDLSMLGLAIPTHLYTQAQQGKTALRSEHNLHSALMGSWYYNIITNLSLLHHSHIGYTHDPIFKDQDLVICSAGPSLKESLPYLKKNRDKITLLAVDTALLSLIQADIIPDYVHSVDAKIHNIADFRGIPSAAYKQMTLLADIILNPQISDLPWKEVLFLSTSHPINQNHSYTLKRTILQQYLWDKDIRFPETQTGGSVSTSAFHLGILYQAKKILLVGQDLAYTNNRGHAIGSPYDMEYRLQTSRLNPLETIHIHKIPFHTKKILAINKNYTYADDLLTQFRSWFEVSIQDNPQLASRLINASANGALFQGWTHIPLSQYQFTSTHTTNKYKLSHYTKEQITSALEELQELAMDIKNPHPICKEFFYKEHNTKNRYPFQITKKTNLFHKKIRRILCQHQNPSL